MGVLAALLAGVGAILAAALTAALAPGRARSASSHREAPLISERPGGRQHRPLRLRQPRPAGHGHDHRQLHPARGAGRRARTSTSSTRMSLYEHQHRQQRRRQGGHHLPVPRSRPTIPNPNTFLYNTGPGRRARRPGPERPADVHRHADRRQSRQSTVLGTNLPVRAGEHRPALEPELRRPGAGRRQDLAGGTQGLRRARATIRSSSISARSSTSAACGRSTRRTSSRSRGEPASTAWRGYNVHTIAIQVPITAAASRSADGCATIGIYASASRREDPHPPRHGTFDATAGPLVQVSRLGNPLINEVVIPLAKKDYWNAADPARTSSSEELHEPELLRASINVALLERLHGTRIRRRGTRRPRRDTAHRASRPQPHRQHEGRPAPAEQRASAPTRRRRRPARHVLAGRPLGLPERAPARGRRHGHRAPRGRLRLRAGPRAVMLGLLQPEPEQRDR